MSNKKQNMGWDFLFSEDCEYDKNDDGSDGYKYSDGSGYYHGADGSRGHKYSDGSGYYHGADGSRGHKYSDGSGYYHGADGSRGHKDSDGSGYYHGADGTSVHFEANDDETDEDKTSTVDWLGLGVTILGVAAAAHEAKSSATRRNNDSDKSISTKELIALISFFLTIIVVFALIIWLSFVMDKKEALKNGMVNAGYYQDLVGEDYEYVVAHFEAAGFTNIELVELNDSGILFWQNDKVDSISVGGNTTFKRIHWFEPDTKVIISYH